MGPGESTVRHVTLNKRERTGISGSGRGYDPFVVVEVQVKRRKKKKKKKEKKGGGVWGGGGGRGMGGGS